MHQGDAVLSGLFYDATKPTACWFLIKWAISRLDNDIDWITAGALLRLERRAGRQRVGRGAAL